MNQEKIGKFIAKCRKDKKMTQQELADKLNVTDRAIGNWENGRRMPDYSIIKDLCNELDITINELFAGEYIKASEKEKHFEKNIMEIFKFNNDKRKKYRIIVTISCILLFALSCYIGRIVLIKKGYLPDPNLAYSQRYELGKDGIKGNVDYNKYESISMDFEIGANKYGYAVFKDPQKALRRLKMNYSKGLQAIQREYKLPPLSMFNFRMYGVYGWQLNNASKEEKEQGIFISHFFDTYENSFN